VSNGLSRLTTHATARSMRYAIEKFPEARRKVCLNGII
jgi:hypothetical protein